MSKKFLVINPDQCVEVQFDQQLTIGRDIYNSLCLKDPELSRSHAIIFDQDGETVIKDLRSRNGVYLRGERVQEGVIQPGDEVILGSTVMLFEAAPGIDLAEALSKRGRYLIERRSGKLPTLPAEPEDVFTAQAMDEAIEALFAKPEGSTYFTTFQAMSMLQSIKEMDAAPDTQTLFDCALRRALASLGGHRGVVMECDETKEHLKMRSIVSADESNTILIGQQVLKLLLNTEKSIFCPDIAKNKRYENMAAKCQRQIHSFVAAPIFIGATQFGFIYLDTEDEMVSYDFAALRSLYFIGFHLGSLMRARGKAKN